MSETPGGRSATNEDGTGADAMPQAVVRPPSRLSLVWLIPLIAVAVGAWLAVKTLSERGPTVTIEFKTASGLSAGQTKVKFKDVDVGQVTAIDVGADLKTVIVTAELKHGFAEHLSENTRFWVERPRVSASGISGLDTLLSGVFIAMDPGEKGRDRRRFKGLEEPPLFSTAEPGTQFVLRSPTLGSLNIGSPVYYRQIQVGQVVGYSLDADGRAVSIEVFVSSPHDALVSGNTRFWNASGIDFSMSGAGFSVDTQSLLSVVIGGVGFDTPETIGSVTSGSPVPENFPLYASREAAHAKTYSRKERYLLFFEGSVRGLVIGAPVLLKGIDIGKVLDIQLQYSVENLAFQIPVLVEVEPDRIAIRGDSTALEGVNLVDRLVSGGLRGQLKFDSLLTGDLYVDLDVYPDAPAATVAKYGGYDVIPTIPTPLEALTTKVTDILGKLDAIPVDQIGRDLASAASGANALVNSPELKQTLDELQGTLAQVRGTAEQLNLKIAPELAKTLEEGTRALERAGSMLSTTSSFHSDMQRMFQEVSAAARSVRVMADYLERHPDALLKGKGR
ncbi:Mammalian cell entry related domain protein [Thiorhodococcus drewsii AZ1]|uniref:Mammalian cell entry related domain protein n=1 Tax=Thiorhodococcus drewsii AZ1 TaxID=765913 RepID=G2E4D1_9GAMM|nr:MlaD family protein [Thiorhodococcus drewsii]EGV29700.1 Mammalian cell entry related domain protein [Thiorhodococcus drewsii AZ1]